MKKERENVGFTAIFLDKIVCWTLPMEVSIYTTEMSAIENILKRIESQRKQLGSVHWLGNLSKTNRIKKILTFYTK